MCHRSCSLFFVSEGLSGSGKSKGPSGTSCWSWRGKELPFAPYRAWKFNIAKMFLKYKEMHIISFNRGKKVTPETVIPIERIKAPILFVSSKRDEVWDYYKSSVIMEKRLNKAGFPYPHKHVGYEYMSHAMMTNIPFFIKLAFKTERQNPGKCAEEREILKKELLEWVNDVWYILLSSDNACVYQDLTIIQVMAAAPKVSPPIVRNKLNMIF